MNLIGFAKCSPTYILNEILKDNIDNKQIDIHHIDNNHNITNKLPYILLIHGTNDTVVPCSSTIELTKVLNKLNIKGKLIYTNNEHIDPLLDGINIHRHLTYNQTKEV